MNKALLLCLVLFLGSCRIDDPGDVILIPSVENEFKIELWEDLTLGQRSLHLLLSTSQPVDCEEAWIQMTGLRTGANQISISIDDIVRASDCSGGQTNALTPLVLGPLVDQSYSVSIDIQRVIENRGRLDVRPTYYQLALQTEVGLVLDRTRLYRIPDHTIWGYINYTTAADRTLVDSWLADLAALGAQPVFGLLDGYYGYFELKNDAITVLPGLAGGSGRAFIFSYNFAAHSGDALQDLVDRYRQQYGTRLRLQLSTSLGQVW